MQSVIQHLREHRAEHLEWSRELCRIPSISTRPEHAADVRKSVEWTADLCRRIGLENVQVFDTARHPLVYADHCHAPGKPTYLIYGHVDVQPTGDRSLWSADPFEPVVDGDWLICRGAADDKGQVVLQLRAAAAWLAAEKRLPVNLKFLIEGEEEIGSPNLKDFVEREAKRLACDAVVISDTGLVADGHPTVTVATRGLLYKEVILRGPKNDLHSGVHGGAIPNPATILAELIASFHDELQRIRIPGFYDDVVELTAEQRAEIARLPFDEAAYLAEQGVTAGRGETGSTQERRTIRPTLEVNGIYGGYMGEGGSTIVPMSAGAKISMRLVPNQNAERLSRIFDETVHSRLPAGVTCEIRQHGCCDAYGADLSSREVQAAKQALQEAFGKPVAMLREGGSLPILPMFRKLLNADSLLVGFASPSCNAHGPNEKVRIPDLDMGAEAVARMWALLGS
jgi:acetylornithine deacetylase/succinyl-diaminopimelate desuccinylase-like protein